MHRECRESFPHHHLQRKPLVSDRGIHHGTRVTHMPWCMSGSLTHVAGKKFPAFPAHAQPTILRIWQEAHAFASQNPRSPHWLPLFSRGVGAMEDWLSLEFTGGVSCRDWTTILILVAKMRWRFLFHGGWFWEWVVLRLGIMQPLKIFQAILIVVLLSDLIS